MTCDTRHVIVKGSRSRLPTPTPSPHDTAQMVLAIVELWVGIVGACQNTVAVEERLVTSVRNLQLLVQAKEAEARENAHADGGDEFLSVRCSGMVQKLVLGGKRNLEERG